MRRYAQNIFPVIIVVLCLFLSYRVAGAQVVITNKHNGQVVKIFCHVSGDDVTMVDGIDSIVIASVYSGRKLQEFVPEVRLFGGRSVPEESQLIWWKDINFDGFDDMVFETGRGNVQIAYSSMFFDPASKRYKKGPDFSSINKPEFDNSSKTITCEWRPGAATHGKSVYKWIKGKVVLVIEETEVRNPGSDEEVITTIRKRVDGKMKVVSVKKE